tara:strand:+ start:300 stop:1034 length:735 start_codon:yes stop_codon:yes gene_type:complete
MIKTVLIDDEKKAIDNLTIMLTEFCKNVEIVGTASSINDGIDVIQSKKPELVFLDIEMPHGTGFDLLSKLDVIDFQVIFVTAYNQYAIQAIKYNALDYILKPIDIDELKNSVDKIDLKEKINERIDKLIKNINAPEDVKKIALADDGGYTMVNINDIIRCEASGNYTVFYVKNYKPLTISRTLKYFEDLLPNHMFVRVHQSHLVNLEEVKKYYTTDGGYLLMNDDSTVSISRRKRIDLEKYFLR